MNVIGYKGSPEERFNNWNMLLVLRQQLEFFKENPNNYLTARKKSSKVYDRAFKDYIRRAA